MGGIAPRLLVQVRRALLIAVGVTAARAVIGRVGALRGVASDLRVPLAILPTAPTGPRHLKFVRWMLTRAPDFPVAPGVTRAQAVASVDGCDSVRVVTFDRPNRSRPTAALLWIHGGGTVIGRPEQSSALCSRWAAGLDLLVVAPDYRLAPEHPFPAGLEDCYTTLRWLVDHAGELGVDRARVVVGGDSAGGLFAAALAQLAADRGGPAISFQLLEYPMLDDRTVLAPDPGPGLSMVWSPAASRFGWTSYLGGAPTEVDDRPFAAPARTEDLSGLPPAWIGVGDRDLLHDEAVAYAGRLTDAGVTCELYVEPGMFHGADSIAPKAPTSRRFVDQMTAALRDAVSGPPAT